MHNDLCPIGAAQGEWSRLRYQQNPMRSGAATVKELTAVLPRDAGQLYFRDEIGNVSTSIVRRLRDKTEVRLQPRFPLLGGWQVSTEAQEPLSSASGKSWPSFSPRMQSTASI